MQSSYQWMLSSENLQEPRRAQSQGIPNVNALGNLSRDPSVEKPGAIPPPTNVAGEPVQKAIPSQSAGVAAPVSAAQPILPKPVLPSTASRSPMVTEQVTATAPQAPAAAPSPQPPSNSPAPQNETRPPQTNATLVHFYVDDPNAAKAENPNLFVDPDTGDRWIRCQNPFCGKWRYLPPEIDVHEGLWFCVMNTWDESIASCDCPQLEEVTVTSKKKEVEKPWLPRLESHFEPINPSDY